MVKRLCEQCAAEFNKSPAQIARGEGRFCSNVCRNEYIRLHPRLGEKAPKWGGGVSKENRTKRSQTYWRNNPEKRRAYDAVKHELRMGRLQKGPCRHCGATTYVHAHHEDYSKPLDIIWLCPSCHLKQHGIYQPDRPAYKRKEQGRERQKREREAVKALSSASRASPPNPS